MGSILEHCGLATPFAAARAELAAIAAAKAAAQ